MRHEWTLNTPKFDSVHSGKQAARTLSHYDKMLLKSCVEGTIGGLMFAARKREVSAEIVGRNLTAHLLDADDCWRAACMLRSYKPSGPIATCEMAFARAALILHLFSEYRTFSVMDWITPRASLDQRNKLIVDRLIASSKELIGESFVDQDSVETDEFYGKSLALAAPEIIEIYSDNLFPLTQLADTLGFRLGVSGFRGIEISPLFEDVERRFRRHLADVMIV